MTFDVEIRDSEEAKRTMQRVRDNLARLEGTRSVALRDLVTAAFLKAHTRFRSLEEMAREGGFLAPGETLTAEQFESFPGDTWDAWIAKATPFPDWRSLLDVAAAEYVKRWLFDGVS